MIAIISHDAGGAELLSSYVKNVKNKYFFCLSGPAIKIFRKKLHKFTNRKLSFCLKKCNEIVASTGETNFEIKAIKRFKAHEKKTTAVLDHWSKYKKRFLFKKNYIFPNEIWASDNISYNASLKIFKMESSKHILFILPN